jgi:hypothetical protein
VRIGTFLNGDLNTFFLASNRCRYFLQKEKEQLQVIRHFAICRLASQFIFRPGPYPRRAPQLCLSSSMSSPPASTQVGPSTGAAAIGGPFILTSHENKMVFRQFSFVS